MNDAAYKLVNSFLIYLTASFFIDGPVALIDGICPNRMKEIAFKVWLHRSADKNRITENCQDER
jgi:hypothetical protein